MNTLINTLMVAGTIVMIQATPAPVQAMNSNGPGSSDAGPVLRQDKVGADLHTIADRKATEVYDRKVMLNEGIYEVVITDENGNLRMTGSYANEDLTQPEGEFTYYYANGNIESKGMYANGVKTGTWHRYHTDGTAKAERNYTGMTWEDMAVTLGMASKAGSN